jgi:hypothetical protein
MVWINIANQILTRSDLSSAYECRGRLSRNHVLTRRALLGIGSVLLGGLVLALLPRQGAEAKDEASPIKGARSVTVQGKDWPADQSDYPVEIICHRGQGKDNERHVFLGHEVRDDFGDVRFRCEAGPLGYWMEECRPGKTARFWVNVPKIPRNDSVRIQLQYGPPEAKSTSNGKKTFRFFDDFLRDYTGQGQQNLPSGWHNTLDIGGRNHWVVKDSILRFRGSGHLTTANKVRPDPAKESFRGSGPSGRIPPLQTPAKMASRSAGSAGRIRTAIAGCACS